MVYIHPVKTAELIVELMLLFTAPDIEAQDKHLQRPLRPKIDAGLRDDHLEDSAIHKALGFSTDLFLPCVLGIFGMDPALGVRNQIDLSLRRRTNHVYGKDELP